MTSAKNFGFSILEAGRNCKMGKFDLEDVIKMYQYLLMNSTSRDFHGLEDTLSN